MKIAIVTLPFHVNYGGYLQAYALQNVLKRMGHKASVIMFDLHPQWRIWASYLKWKVWRRVKRQYGIEDSFKDFLMLHINKRYYRQVEDIQEDDFDAFVVGSDQVWRKKFVKNLFLAFLAFTKNWDVKRLAYAPSFGITDWDYTDEETVMCKDMLKRFTMVSVREKSGVDLCKRNLDVNPILALDPTLIAPKSIYIHLIDKRIENVGTFVYYVKKNEASIKVQDVLSTLNCGKYKEIALPCEGVATENLPTVSLWLSFIANADYVLTDSFHACVFCLLFHKPFLAMPSGWGGKSRFESLLVPLGLEYRILQQTTLDICSRINKNIDWDGIDELMAEASRKSFANLGKALKNKEDDNTL